MFQVQGKVLTSWPILKVKTEEGLLLINNDWPSQEY